MTNVRDAVSRSRVGRRAALRSVGQDSRARYPRFLQSLVAWTGADPSCSPLSRIDCAMTVAKVCCEAAELAEGLDLACCCRGSDSRRPSGSALSIRCMLVRRVSRAGILAGS